MDQLEKPSANAPLAARWNMEVVIGILLILLAIAAIVASSKFPSTGLETDVGSARFPRIFSVAIIILSLILIGQNLLPKNTQNEEKTPEEEAMEILAALSKEDDENNGSLQEAEKPLYWKAFVGIVASFVCLGAMPFLGYALTATPYIACLMVLLGMRNKLWNPLIAIAIAGILYITFSTGLNVPLPVGSFFE